MGPTSEFNIHMYIIHFLNILYQYMCATCAHLWGKCLGATYRGQFCWWRASINPRFAFAIICRSPWGSTHPLNTCTLCKACSSRKSSNPVARTLQPPWTHMVFYFNASAPPPKTLRGNSKYVPRAIFVKSITKKKHIACIGEVNYIALYGKASKRWFCFSTHAKPLPLVGKHQFVWSKFEGCHKKVKTSPMHL